MEDIRAIYRIFNNLKYEMENNGWVYQWHLGDEPIKVTHKFNPPVTPEEFQLFEKYFPNMKLPASYKAFLSCSNGMELFCGEEGSSLVSCTIYSLKRALKEKESWNSTPILSDPEFTYHLPVLCLQDIGDITMDLQAVSEGRDDYLCYPAPTALSAHIYTLSFNTISSAHAFILFINPTHFIRSCIFSCSVTPCFSSICFTRVSTCSLVS